MLKTKNVKLKAMFKDKSVMLTVEPIIDYSNEEFSSDLINFIIEKMMHQ